MARPVRRDARMFSPPTPNPSNPSHIFSFSSFSGSVKQTPLLEANDVMDELPIMAFF